MAQSIVAAAISASSDGLPPTFVASSLRPTRTLQKCVAISRIFVSAWLDWRGCSRGLPNGRQLHEQESPEDHAARD